MELALIRFKEKFTKEKHYSIGLLRRTKTSHWVIHAKSPIVKTQVIPTNIYFLPKSTFQINFTFLVCHQGTRQKKDNKWSYYFLRLGQGESNWKANEQTPCQLNKKIKKPVDWVANLWKESDPFITPSRFFSSEKETFDYIPFDTKCMCVCVCVWVKIIVPSKAYLKGWF